MRWLGTLVATMWLASCASAPRLVLPPPPAPAPVVVPWIRISKTQHTLTLYEGVQPVKQYAAVFGKDPYWAKLYEGDRRTPEGEYHIIDKYYHEYWSRFMLLDYPTLRNQEIYDWSLEHGAIPSEDGMPAGIGGAIGIHGTKDDELNRRGINWTLGCISLFNRDIDDLYERVPVGTRVLIER